eukprot:m51a1_g9611 hypothetical protein (95) ;mRNA; r:1075979-1078605
MDCRSKAPGRTREDNNSVLARACCWPLAILFDSVDCFTLLYSHRGAFVCTLATLWGIRRGEEFSINHGGPEFSSSEQMALELPHRAAARMMLGD